MADRLQRRRRRRKRVRWLEELNSWKRKKLDDDWWHNRLIQIRRGDVPWMGVYYGRKETTDGS